MRDPKQKQHLKPPLPRRPPHHLSDKLRRHSPWLLLLWLALSVYFFVSVAPPAAAPLLRPAFLLPSNSRALSSTTAPHVRIYVYNLPHHFNRDWAAADLRFVLHLFTAEVMLHKALLPPGPAGSSYTAATRPEEADLFFVLVYISCNFSMPNGFPSLSHAQGLLAKAVDLVRREIPYWNRSTGAGMMWWCG